MTYKQLKAANEYVENIRVKYSKRYYRSLHGVDTSVAEMERQAAQLEAEL